MTASLTTAQRQLVAHAIMIAENASRDLCSKAADGPSARPSVATLNRTIERLASIETTLKAVLS